MKKFFSKAHLWLSIPFGIVIVIICFTGAILVFQTEILESKRSSVYFAENPTGERLTPSELVARVQKELPDSVKVTGLKIYEDAERNSQIYVSGDGDDFYVDPYTGKKTGTDERSMFFSKVIRLHRFLLHQYDRGSQPWGKLIVGYSTIAFVFIILTGLVIWFPRSRKSLKNRLQIKTNSGWHRFWYDLHVTGGFYSSLFLLAMALTGLTWSFGWYRTAFYNLLSSEPTTEQQSSGQPAGSGTSELNYTQWDKMVPELQSRYSSYNYLILKQDNATVYPRKSGNTSTNDRYYFDANGKVTGATYYKDKPFRSRLGGWVYAVHTGKWGGMTTRILSCLAAFMGGVFVLTGYYFWIRKIIQKNKKRR